MHNHRYFNEKRLIHAIGDMLSSVGVVVAAILIYVTGLSIIDTFVSVSISLVIAYWGINLIRDSSYILLEGIPKELDVSGVIETIKKIVDEPAVVHHVHAWQISTHIYAYTAHVTINHKIDQREATEYLQEMQKTLAERFNIHHTTIQFETKGCTEET